MLSGQRTIFQSALATLRMAQCVKAVADNPSDLSSIPRTHRAEDENQLRQNFDFTMMYMPLSPLPHWLLLSIMDRRPCKFTCPSGMVSLGWRNTVSCS